MPPAFLVKKAILTRRPRGSLTGWDDFPLVLSSISEGDNCTDIRLRAVSLFSVVRRAKRETHEWPRARLPPSFRASRGFAARARVCTPPTKPEEKERLLAVYTDIAQSYNIKINDQVPGPQLNARGVYKKINSFDQAFFQSQSRLIDKIQCASLYLFMVGTELFHLSHDYSSTYGLSSFGRFILFRNRSSTGG